MWPQCLPNTRARDEFMQLVPKDSRWSISRRNKSVLRYGLERHVIIRIWDHLDGFRMIRLAFYIWESYEIDRRHVPPISEAIRGSGGIEYSYVSTKAKKVSTLRGPAQLADLQEALWVPTNNFTSGQIAMSRYTNSNMYCPQQISPMSACFGLTQGDLESEYNTRYPFSSVSVYPLSFLLPNWLFCVWCGYGYW